MPANKKATDRQVRDAYAKHGSVWKAGRALGMCGQSVHERLIKLGVDTGMNTFTDEDIDRIANEYTHYRDAGMLSVLAKDMGRTVPFLSRKARDLGLTGAGRKAKWQGKWKYMPEEVARKLFQEFIENELSATEHCRRRKMGLEGFSATMRRFFPKEWEAAIESKVKHGRGRLYRNGRAFEYRVRDMLIDKGYYVIRAPQSKGIADLVAVSRGAVLFVQCKRTGSMEVAEWNKLFDTAKHHGAVPVLANSKNVGVDFWLIEKRKDGSRRRQPMSKMEPCAYMSKWAA